VTLVEFDMDTSADTLDQADEEILTYAVSDEEIEAAGGIEIGAKASAIPPQSAPCLLRCTWQ
jgi:hypothetical protein